MCAFTWGQVKRPFRLGCSARLGWTSWLGRYPRGERRQGGELALQAGSKLLCIGRVITWLDLVISGAIALAVPHVERLMALKLVALKQVGLVMLICTWLLALPQRSHAPRHLACPPPLATSPFPNFVAPGPPPQCCIPGTIMSL